MKKIILCADDFGQSAAISEGILQLVQARRLSAVSCMTDGVSWSDDGNTLIAAGDAIDIGLHFNLTHGFPHQFFPARPLGALMLAALSGRLAAAELTRALHDQLDRFEAVAKRAPDFVDGHQHVHMFPGIRGTLLRELSRRYPHDKPYLRTVDPRLQNPSGVFKLGILKLLNGGFRRAAAHHNLQLTTGFGGVYSLQPDADFAALMSLWLRAAQQGDLLMCHPGRAANDANDPIAATRPRELAFLGSAEFAALLLHEDVRLSRFRSL